MGRVKHGQHHSFTNGKFKFSHDTDEGFAQRVDAHMLCILALSVLCYLTCLHCGFVFDDVSAIKDNKDLRSHVPLHQLFLNDFWGTPMVMEKSHKSYRPLTVLTFRWNYAISGLAPFTYHLGNLILHAVVSALFLDTCRVLFGRSHPACNPAGYLFAVHPIHTEAVAGVVGRAELLAAIFFLLAVQTFIKYQSGFSGVLLSVFCTMLGTLCKEQCITVIGICVFHELYFINKSNFTYSNFAQIINGKSPWVRHKILRCVTLVGTVIVLLWARIKVMGAQLPVFTNFDNPAAHAEFPARQFTYNLLLPLNFLLLIFPQPLCADWTMGSIPLLHSPIADPVRFSSILIFYALIFGLVHLALRDNNQHYMGVSIVFLVLPFIPASNLFFPVGFVIAERVLYLPSMGFCMLVAFGYVRLLSHFEPEDSNDSTFNIATCIKLGFIFTIVVFGAKTLLRNDDWKDEYSLFTSAVRVNKLNAKLWNNVGHSHEAREEYAQALPYFRKASSIQPDDVGAHQNVARTYVSLKEPVMAEKYFRKAMALLPQPKKGQTYTARVAPNHLKVFTSLAALISNDSSRWPEADKLLLTAMTMRPDFIDAYQNRADLLIKMGKTNDARAHYQKALQFSPNHADILFNLGVLDLKEDKKNSALAWFEKALKAEPDHKLALHNAASLFSESQRSEHKDVARQRIQKLSELEPENPNPYFSLAMLETDAKNFPAAELQYRRALYYDPTLRSALFNLALLYNIELGKPMLAKEAAEQLLRHHPDHVKGHILLGDIHLNVLKDLTGAAAYFSKAVKLDPKSAQALHNLCVVHVEGGDLHTGEKCLLQALALGPQEHYIQHHLKIVQDKIKSLKSNKADKTSKSKEDGENIAKPSQDEIDGE